MYMNCYVLPGCCLCGWCDPAKVEHAIVHVDGAGHHVNKYGGNKGFGLKHLMTV